MLEQSTTVFYQCQLFCYTISFSTYIKLFIIFNVLSGGKFQETTGHTAEQTRHRTEQPDSEPNKPNTEPFTFDDIFSGNFTPKSFSSQWAQNKVSMSDYSYGEMLKG